MAVRQEYLFDYIPVYELTYEDGIEIVTDILRNEEWENGFKTFKDNIRTHLKLAQRKRCAFCRCKISTGTSYSNLEHIVSKSEYAQFICNPDNLVYSCLRCNFSKVKKLTLVNPDADKDLQDWPINSLDFNIINPYYDNYEQHIDFIDDVIIVTVNNSSKGLNTISYYKLTRTDLAEERATELKLDVQTLNHRLLNRLTDATLDNDIRDQIDAIILEMPNWVVD